MQSALEQEFGFLLARARRWLSERDRAVLIGAMLCCVPFLPITLIGLLVTLANLALVAWRRLPRAELPLLAVAVAISVFYLIGWWLLFRTVRASAIWSIPAQWWLWQWLRGLLTHLPSHPVQTI